MCDEPWLPFENVLGVGAASTLNVDGAGWDHHPLGFVKVPCEPLEDAGGAGATGTGVRVGGFGTRPYSAIRYTQSEGWLL